MLNKLFFFSFCSASVLLANQLVILPINPAELSTENGGTLSAIDAYKNGTGAIIAAKAELKIDNSPMNQLVFKYGEEAKANNQDLKPFVLGNQSADDKDLSNANKLSSGIAASVIPTNGTSCDDHNLQTINDIYVNGSCIGNNVEGQSCNDNNIQTINDKYVNGVCLGTNVEGQSCNDGNIQTTNDIYHNGVCLGTKIHLDVSLSYSWDQLIAFGAQANRTFVSGYNAYGGTATGGIFNSLMDSYFGGLYFSKHIENTSLALGYMTFQINEKGRIWAGSAGGNQPYDSDLDLFIYSNNSWVNVSSLMISVKGKKIANSFVISSSWLEPGLYKVQRKTGVYSSYSTSSTYEGLRADTEWYIEKY